MRLLLNFSTLALILNMFVLTSCAQQNDNKAAFNTLNNSMSDNTPSNQSDATDTAIFGSGCFWCGEAVFEELKGVFSVESGYSGGFVENPTYKQVSSGSTGHAEVFRVIFDPTVISYADLLEVFWETHDPTTLNRQGYDVGTQYRSVIFYANEDQRQLAMASKQAASESHLYDAPIITEISPLTEYYPAEDYHQDYYNNNPNQGYCTRIIGPKVEKFRKRFRDKLKN